MAKPAGEGGAGGFGMFRGDIDEGRAAGAGIEVFVGATDGEIRVAPGQIDRQRPRRMRQIPDHKRARLVRGRAQRRHVVPAPGAIVDLGQHQDRDLVVDGIGHRFGRYGAQGIALAKGAHQPVGHIQVGREIAGVRQDHLARRVQFQRRGQRLVDLDRQRVAHHHRAGCRPDQPRDPVADTGGLIHPSGLVPAGDQHLAPFVRDRVRHPRGRRTRQGAKRVAIQIGDTLWQIEHPAGFCEIGWHGKAPLGVAKLAVSAPACKHALAHAGQDANVAAEQGTEGLRKHAQAGSAAALAFGVCGLGLGPDAPGASALLRGRGRCGRMAAGRSGRRAVADPGRADAGRSHHGRPARATGAADDRRSVPPVAQPDLSGRYADAGGISADYWTRPWRCLWCPCSSGSSRTASSCPKKRGCGPSSARSSRRSAPAQGDGCDPAVLCLCNNLARC